MSELHHRQVVDALVDALVPAFAAVGVDHVLTRIQSRTVHLLEAIRTEGGRVRFSRAQLAELVSLSVRNVARVLHEEPGLLDEVPGALDVMADVLFFLRTSGPRDAQSIYRFLRTRPPYSNISPRELQSFLELFTSLGVLQCEVAPHADWLVYAPVMFGSSLYPPVDHADRLEALRNHTRALVPCASAYASGLPGTLYVSMQGHLLPEHYRVLVDSLSMLSGEQLNALQEASRRISKKEGRACIPVQGLVAVAPLIGTEPTPTTGNSGPMPGDGWLSSIILGS
ncbi:MAG: hypothetical protein ACKO6N_17175 [Myxococcota bacterium]